MILWTCLILSSPVFCHWIYYNCNNC